MSHKPTLRALTIALLIAAMGTGCARMPMGAQAALPTKRTGAAQVKAAPVSADALVTARKWNAQATQVGVSIIRAESGDDVATYVYSAPGKTDAMLLVIATPEGFKAQEVPLNARASEGIAKMTSLSSLDAKLLDSKDLFKRAAAAGLEAPRDLVVLAARDHAGSVAAALVNSQDAQSYIILDAESGKALSAVSRMSERKVLVHELALAVVIVGAVGTAVVWGAKKLIAKFWHPKPKPSATPTPAPSAAPSSAPTETPSPVLSAPPGEF